MHFETTRVVRQASLLQFKSQPILKQQPDKIFSNGAKTLSRSELLHATQQKPFSVPDKRKAKTQKIKISKKKQKERNQRLRLSKAIVFHRVNSRRKTKKRLIKTMVDYKNIPLLRRYISFEGKILPRRISLLPRKNNVE